MSQMVFSAAAEARGLRGFALLKARDPERMRAISQAAGKSSQANHRGHRWTSDEASRAGKKSGQQRRRFTSIPLAS